MAPLHEFFKLKPQALCRAYLSSAQNDLVTEEEEKVNLDAETYDPGSNFDTTNNRFQAPVAGFYLVTAQVTYNSIVADKVYGAFLKVNSTTKTYAFQSPSLVFAAPVPVTDILQLAADDYVYLYAYQESGVDTVDLLNQEIRTYMAIHFLSAS